jgi:alkylation response protein AidB-like acyl-CoA dehydrogenase
VRAGIPDALHVHTIQIVGLFLLLAGDEEQKRAHLPALAGGERFATVLCTEPAPGADPAAVRTTATRDRDGWRLDGVTVHSLAGDVAGLGLCAARTGPAGCDGISLFLVDMSAAGVLRGPVPDVAGGMFRRIELAGVRVGAEALLGEPGEGRRLISQVLARSRTGLDYALRTQHRLDAVRDGLAQPDDAVLVRLGRYAAKLDAGRLLIWRALGLAGEAGAAATAAAAARRYSSDLAQEIADWAVEVHGYGYTRAWLSSGRLDMLEPGYREASAWELSAGTSEVMLQIIDDLGLDAYERDDLGQDDPARRGAVR